MNTAKSAYSKILYGHAPLTESESAIFSMWDVASYVPQWTIIPAHGMEDSHDRYGVPLKGVRSAGNE